MKLLLTGATGFVGRNFLLAALESGNYQEIYVTVRSREKLETQFKGDGFAELPTSVIPVEGSAREWNLPDREFDHVVHCAGSITAKDLKEYRQVNVEGTLSLLRGLKGAPSVVILSSHSASGPCFPPQTKKTEADSERPVTWYGQSKLEMEQKVREQYPGLNFILIRPPMVLGPRDHATLALFKMVRMPVHFKPGMKPKYYSYISVQDLAGAIQSALAHSAEWAKLPRRTFFVSAGEPVSDQEILRVSAEVSRRSGIVVKLPHPLVKAVSQVVDAVPLFRRSIPSLSADRVKEVWPERWVISSSSFETAFNWAPKETLNSVLSSTNDWYVRTGQVSS